jgi:hypothetical protein
MQFRTVFISDRKQVKVPEGWEIENVQTATPARGKPQFMVLMKKKETPERKPIGFKTRKA